MLVFRVPAFRICNPTYFQIMEMLEPFAISPDKSIGLTEFESFVITARLVWANWAKHLTECYSIQ